MLADMAQVLPVVPAFGTEPDPEQTPKIAESLAGYRSSEHFREPSGSLSVELQG